MHDTVFRFAHAHYLGGQKIPRVTQLYILKLWYCHGYRDQIRDAGNVSLRSVLILFRILHVETMFGNEFEGEGFLHACISCIILHCLDFE